MSDNPVQTGGGPVEAKKEYPKLPMFPPGGPYCAVVVAEGVAQKPGKPDKYWAKVRGYPAPGAAECEAFLDIYATPRSVDLYLPKFLHAFGVAISATAATDLWGGKTKLKGRPVSFDVEASDRPKADGTPWYKAVHPRRFGEEKPKYVGRPKAPASLNLETLAQFDARLNNKTENADARIQRARQPFPPPAPVIPPPQAIASPPPQQIKPPTSDASAFFSE